MKNLNSKLKGIALAVSIFAMCACSGLSLFAQPTISQQSNCFTISAVAAQDSNGCSGDGMCGPNANNVKHCQACIIVTLCMDKCTGILPTKFQVSSVSSTDCHSICSADADVAILDGNCADGVICTTGGGCSKKCSYCDPRELGYTGNSGNGLADNGCLSFRICHRYDSPYVQQTYHIKISAPNNSQCGGSQCTDAIITF
ncbi:MAG: hypothetical protein WCH46_05335 [bacterium]